MTDREIDVLIAERVFGWREIGPHEPFYKVQPDGGYISDGIPYKFQDEGALSGAWFRPTRDANADYEVLKAILENSQRAEGAGFVWEMHAQSELTRMRDALLEIQSRRACPIPELRYQPGDYSRAVAKCLLTNSAT